MSIQKRFTAGRTIISTWAPARLNQLTSGELGTDVKELLIALGLTDTNSIAISKATAYQVRTVTGIDVVTPLEHFVPPYLLNLQKLNQLPAVDPSPSFLDQMSRFDKWFESTADESLIRSKIDICLTEAMEHVARLGSNPNRLKYYGEATFRMHDPVSRLTLNGDADYCLVWGEPGEPDRVRLENVSLIIEAKTTLTLAAGRKQLMTYMAIAYHARRRAKKAQAGVFGVLTNAKEWFFYRIDNEGNPSHSLRFVHESENQPDYAEVLRHLAFISAAAQALSPATTPFTSVEQLRNSSFSSLESVPGFDVALSTEKVEETERVADAELLLKAELDAEDSD
ncbi:hypothetical protein HDU87_000553 [Geranomyces variabilis]|uniref:Uncharacterized protein n=1 Tax=Geranomyces variabilis TaxID=109894 RepID=A0AAD5TBX6_9FUNG|nr:hypothetical protein HDU87_000553 [Geranomyces variabilis]